jgi:ABC-type dipeptide/oligopeptide/nickel transport system permease subunit
VTTAPAAATLTQRRGSSRAWGYLRTNPTFWIGAIGVTLIVGAAIFAPLIAPHDPNYQFRGEGLTPGGDPLGPTAKFPLGTDKLGRDEFSRLVRARTSLTVGIVANSLAIFIGVLVGTTAAYSRGRAEFGRTILMRTTDAVLAFRRSWSPSPWSRSSARVSGWSSWSSRWCCGRPARITYSTSLVVLSSDFVVAATAIGASDEDGPSSRLATPRPVIIV